MLNQKSKYESITKIIEKFIIDDIPKIDSDIIFKYLEFANPTDVEKLYLAACQYGEDEIVNQLLNYIPNIHLNLHDDLSLTINNNRYSTLSLLLKHGVDVHKFNDAALILAVRTANIPIIKLLIEYGANIHANNDDAFRVACTYNMLDIAKLLIDLGANIHADPYLICDCINNSATDVIKLLIELGVSANTINPTQTVFNYYSNMSKNIMFLDHLDDPIHVLQIAIHSKNYEIIEILLKNGANIHIYDDYVLRYSMFHMDDIIKLLLDYGANPFVGDNICFFLAANNNKTWFVEYMLQNGININMKINNFDMGTTDLICGVNALYGACVNGALDTVRLLISHGIDYNIDNIDLIISIIYANHDITMELLNSNYIIDNEDTLQYILKCCIKMDQTKIIDPILKCTTVQNATNIYENLKLSDIL